MGTAWKQQREADWQAMGKGADDVGKYIDRNIKIANANLLPQEELDKLGLTQPPGPKEDLKIPAKPDATDELIKKARSNAYLRLQAGNNRKSSMAAGTLGGFDIAKPVLGSY